jgi:predicted transcriptional regulator
VILFHTCVLWQRFFLHVEKKSPIILQNEEGMLQKTLRDYMKKYDLSITLFAKKSRLSYNTIRNILFGLGKISYSTAEAISKATKGEISYEYLIEFVHKQN